MKTCDRCFTEVDSDAEFCKECGASLNGNSSKASDSAVYPLLAKANLLRMRGDHQNAVDVCLSVLKQFPYNSTAHILLGDIHMDMGKRGEALDWYELAIDLEPENSSLVAKRDRLRAEKEKAESSAAVAGLEVPPSGARTAAIYGFVVLLVILIAAAAFYIGRGRGESMADVNLDDLVRPVSIGETAPPAVPTNPAEPPQPNENQHQDQARPIEQPLSMDAFELQMKTDIAARLGPLGARLAGVDFDPRNGSTRLTLRSGGETDLIDAATAAVAALATSANTQRVHVRMIDSSGSLSFLGTVERTSLATAQGYAEGSAEWAAAIVTNVYRR